MMVLGYPSYEDDKPGKHSKPDSIEDVVPPLSPSVAKETPKVISKIGIPWKAILGFLTVFGAQLMARAVVDGVAVIPENLSGWLALFGGSFVAALVIYIKGNTYTMDQAQTHLDDAENRASP